MKKFAWSSLFLVLTVFGAAALAQDPAKTPLRLVPDVDFERYQGRWYEIARLPNRFQKRCLGDVSADYRLKPNGDISVVNQCRAEGGERIDAEGVAHPAGKGQPKSVLKVRFAPSFLSFLPMVWGDYQVMALAPDYSHALVGAPSREYLWILSRTPRMDDATYNALVKEAAAQGFDVAMLQKTAQGS